MAVVLADRVWAYSLEAAIRFGRENGQLAIYILSTGEEIRLEE